MSSVEEQAASVLYDHEWNQNGDDKCACGWTQDVVDHVVHQAQALADAGLLARELPSRDEIAEAISDEFWHMQGGEGSNPEPPNPGDMQLAAGVLALLRGENDDD